jgi:hypothetical protein
MRILGGILMILMAAMVGIVEFRAIVDPAVAQDVARKFAEHDPFPRLPLARMSFLSWVFCRSSEPDCSSFLQAKDMERHASNQSMKPTAPFRSNLSVLATDPARGLSLSR